MICPPLQSAARLRCLSVIALVLALCVGLAMAEDQATGDATWEQHPMLAEVKSLTPPPNLEPDQAMLRLWLLALKRPNASTRLEAAEAFGHLARSGATPIAQTVGSDLVQAARRETDPLARRALARALVSMDATNAATLGWAEAEDVELHLITDAALARWNAVSAAPAWQKRLTGTALPDHDRASAARALGVLQDAEFLRLAVPMLTDKITSDVLRLEIGRAVLGFRDTALVDASKKLAVGGKIDRILAAMLARCATPDHQGDALSVASSLLDDSDPIIVQIALASLNQIDADQARRAAIALCDHADAAVRVDAIGLLAHDGPSVTAAITPVTARLGDSAISVRTAAAETLLSWGDGPNTPMLEEALTRALEKQDWRSLEQAAGLAGTLQMTSASDRLMELVTHPRLEVSVAAAMALRRLSLTDTSARLMKQAQLWIEKAKGNTAGTWPREESLAQLILALGQMRVNEAAPMLQTLVKDKELPLLARQAAVWALGQIHADSGNRQAIKLMKARASDRNINFPEDEVLQIIAILAIGRIGSDAEAATLRRWHGDNLLGRNFQRAAGAAYASITGETLPPLPKPRQPWTKYFLMPIQ